jgi:hypothetical protein
VGQDEEPISSMGSAGIARSNARPLRIEPERGQGPEHVAEAGSIIDGEQARHVFPKQETRTGFGKDSSDMREDPSVVASPFSLAGEGGGLARPTGEDGIDEAKKDPTVDASQVIADDQSRRQIASFHPLDQDRGGVGIGFDVGDDAGSGLGELEPSLKTSDAGAEGENIHAASVGQTRHNAKPRSAIPRVASCSWPQESSTTRTPSRMNARLTLRGKGRRMTSDSCAEGDDIKRAPLGSRRSSHDTAPSRNR